MIAIAIAGAAGRMGQALRAAAGPAGFRLVGATERSGAPDLGAEIAPGVRLTADAAAAAAGAAAWIDFTTPDAAIAALGVLPPGVAAIIGATGFTPAQLSEIEAAARDRPIVRAGNFSVGVAVLAGLVREAAARLGAGWDIEIVEAHHRAKMDAPSGTALLLGEAAARGRGADLAALRLGPRDGLTGPRPEDGIGFAVIRAGGIVGEHEVMFASDRESLRLSHHAEDRAIFAEGALVAARWAVGQPPGLYGMSDVLGFAR